MSELKSPIRTKSLVFEKNHFTILKSPVWLVLQNAFINNNKIIIVLKTIELQ